MVAMPITGPAVAGFEMYDQRLPALLEKWHIPGATVAVAVDGRIIFARGYGFADPEAGRPMQPDTRMRIGSISKMLTAAAVLKLVEDGRLSLQDRAFLGWPTPTYAGAARDPRLDRITVAHLLSHTAGWISSEAEIPFSGGQRGFNPVYLQRQIAEILGQPPPASAETIAQVVVGQPLQAEPGRVYAYTNTGYIVLGRLIERATGQTYEEAVRTILGRVGISGLRIGDTRRSELEDDEAVYVDYPGAALMESHIGDTGLVPEPYAYSLHSWDASGGWTMSAIEGVRFLLALEGAGDTPRLLRSDSVTAMRTEQYPGSAYGYGWCTSNHPFSSDGGHNGGMAGTLAELVRSSDGRRHTMVIFNSRPADVDGILAESAQVLHSVDSRPATFAHDFTTTTLGWEAWQQRTLASAAAEPLDDPDHDGVTNLLEYAAGLDPTRRDSPSPASLTIGSDGVAALTFQRLILEQPLEWKIESSADGRNWSAIESVGAPAGLTPDGTLSMSVRVPGAARARLLVRQRSSGAEAVFEPVLSPRMVALTAGESTTLSAVVPPDTPLQWRRNGEVIPGATTSNLTLRNVWSADAGIYTVDIGGDSPSTCLAAIVGIRSVAKVMGDGIIVGSDVRHPNGNIYDQVLLTGAAATVTADPAQVTRVSFVDLNDDIVQVEFSGSGSLTVALAGASEPALPRHYHQDIRYVKGHATLVIADADETTNVSAFSVGRGNAVNQALFKADVAYDGIADLAALALHGSAGKAAGIFMGNAHLFAASGVTGIFADGIAVSGPARLGNISAYDRATPMLVFGSLADLAITGGDLKQENARPVQVRGLGAVYLTAGGKSDGTALPAQPNQARFELNGADVTPWLVAP
ncbi:serine hydrolase [Opitutus terrae]|uniref:Beta-lactamase n=1 Tax=Opitutus terrae (strain DSM 11246 / JCM 15787 / PB90-1) TaxID=452637 RepID=B1ZMZ1_OPITP|nr:serine hydrolase [Opitutus terrae]ACB76443.1 beta-lactamase [Opitutus terrae PB90-1]